MWKKTQDLVLLHYPKSHLCFQPFIYISFEIFIFLPCVDVYAFFPMHLSQWTNFTYIFSLTKSCFCIFLIFMHFNFSIFKNKWFYIFSNPMYIHTTQMCGFLRWSIICLRRCEMHNFAYPISNYFHSLYGHLLNSHTRNGGPFSSH